MAATRRSQVSKDSSEREKWRKILNTLTRMLQKQQIQLESFADEMKFAKDLIKTLYDRFPQDSRLFDCLIDQVKRNSRIHDMSIAVQSAKTEMLIGLKNREAAFYKLKSDDLKSELVDFRACVEHLTMKLSTTEDARAEAKGEKRRREYEKLLSEKEAEASALRSEQGFVWNQYRIMEGDLAGKLKEKEREAELSREKVEALLLSVERLHSEAVEKDRTIAVLRADVDRRNTISGLSNCGSRPTVSVTRSSLRSPTEPKKRAGTIAGFRADVPEVKAESGQTTVGPLGGSRSASVVTATRPFGELKKCGFRPSVSATRAEQRSPAYLSQPRCSTQKRKQREEYKVLKNPFFNSSLKPPKLS